MLFNKSYNSIQLSTLLECDSTVCLPEKRSPEDLPEGDLIFRGETIVGSHSNKGDNWYIISNIFASDTK